jgi:hypothetical protein
MTALTRPFIPRDGARFPVWFALVTYVVSFGAMLLIGDYRIWDDAATYANADSGAQMFDEAGSTPLRTWLEFDVLRANPVLFRLVTLVAYFFAAWLFHGILRRTPGISVMQARVAALLFLVAPVNSARIAMIMTFTAVSTVLFVAGWRLLIERRSLARILGLVALGIGVATPALQPMILLPVAHLLYVAWKSGADCRRATFWTPLVLLLLPVIAELLQTYVWPPDGSYEQYYAIRLVGVVRASFVLALALMLLLAHWYRRHRSGDATLSTLLSSIGIVILAIGAFPYIVGGHLTSTADWLLPMVPEHSDWDSRHTALFGLGIGMIGAGFTGRSAEGDATRTPLLTRGVALTLSLFVFLNAIFSIEYLRDVIEKRDFVAEVAGTVDLTGVQSLIIRDWSAGIDARGRSIRDAEWLYLLGEAGWGEVEYVYRSGFADCNPEPPTHALVIASTTGSLATLLRRDTDLWVKVEPYDEKEYGTVITCEQ